MRQAPDDRCYRCEFFSLRARPELAPLGRGECSGFVITPTSVRDWNDPACALFRLARADLAAREAWAEKR